MRQFRSQILPSPLNSTTTLVNWDLELTKAILEEKILNLKRFCLRELNLFIDNIIEIPLLGKFEDFIKQVYKANNFVDLEKNVLLLIDYVDGVFENLIARGEQVIPDFKLTLPRFLNLPALRRKVSVYIVEEILPLFVSEYTVAPVMRSHR